MSVTVSLKTTGIDRYKANLGKVNKIVGKAAADVEATAKRSIKTNSGKFKEYEKGHWSSPPGSPQTLILASLRTASCTGC